MAKRKNKGVDLGQIVDFIKSEFSTPIKRTPVKTIAEIIAARKKQKPSDDFN